MVDIRGQKLPFADGGMAKDIVSAVQKIDAHLLCLPLQIDTIPASFRTDAQYENGTENGAGDGLGDFGIKTLEL